MKNKLLITSFLILILIQFTSCTSNLPKTTLTITRSDGSTVPVTVEIASTSEQRQKGFMNRKNIPDGTGMIFVFEQDQILSFWMKNTPHPLSIAYIDRKGKIRDILPMTPYSLSTIVSSGSVRYALEVPQNWFEKNNIQEGDFISLNFLE